MRLFNNGNVLSSKRQSTTLAKKAERPKAGHNDPTNTSGSQQGTNNEWLTADVANELIALQLNSGYDFANHGVTESEMGTIAQNATNHYNNAVEMWGEDSVQAENAAEKKYLFSFMSNHFNYIADEVINTSTGEGEQNSEYYLNIADVMEFAKNHNNPPVDGPYPNNPFGKHFGMKDKIEDTPPILWS
jgi:hypothetical protein